jgi:putative polyhydroxyalkanoate system protein
MSRIHIRRSHELGHAEARARVERLATKLAERFGADCRWEGDDLVVEHSNLTGCVSVRRTEIVVEGRLGFALSFFHSRAEQEISKLLDEQLRA